MRIVCLTGNDREAVKGVQKILRSLGYNILTTYVTRGYKDKLDYETKEVSRSRFERLIDKGVLASYGGDANDYYGVMKPVGQTLNVVIVNEKQLVKFKETYKKQVVGVQIINGDGKQPIMEGIDIALGASSDYPSLTASILKKIQENSR